MREFVTCIWVALGGAIGTLARYGLSVAAVPISRDLPVATILINILGSFVIGFVGSLTLSDGRYPFSDNLRLFVLVGLCGGFTTFSSFSLQTFDLLRTGAVMRATLNVVLSVTLCLIAVAAGHRIASSLNSQATAVVQIDKENT